MRIISGIYKGRKINPPGSLPVRPTTDYAKEGLFNVLNNLLDFEETTVLDLFAGTGNMSFEFMSRGCPEVMSVDIEQRCISFIHETAQKLGMEGLKALRSNVMVFLKHPRKQYGLVFADPPYEMRGIDRLPEEVLGSGLVAPDGWVVIEHSSRYEFTKNPYYLEMRQYGRVHFSIFRLAEPLAED